MAVTKIKSIKSTLKSALDYIMDEEKTDGTLLVSGGNCTPEVAYLEFKMTQDMCKEVVGDYSKKSNNLAYHTIQSFDKKDNITPEEAHKIGEELAKKLTGDKYEYVVATHIDKGHIHNHIIFNAYSFSEHRKFNCNKNTFKELRAISDELCRESGLNVIENPKGKGKSYKEDMETKKGTSWKAYIKDTIDELIEKVNSFEELKSEMIKKGFEIKEGKYIAFKAPNQQRFCRGKTIGEEYTKEAIESRINENNKVKDIVFNKDMIINQNSKYYFVRVPATENHILINKNECNWINKHECKIVVIKDDYKFIDFLGKEEVLTAKELKNYFKTYDKKISDIKLEDIKIDEDVFKTRRNKIRDVKELANAIVLLRKESIENKEQFNNKIQEVINKRDKTKDTFKDLENKNSKFNQIAKYLITYNSYKDIYDKYNKKKTIFGSYKKYESEILMFIQAKEKIEELGINTDVSIEKIKEKINIQKDEIRILGNQFKNLDKRLENIRNANNKIENIINDKDEIKRDMER